MGFNLTKCLLQLFVACAIFDECAFQASSKDMKKTTRVFSPGHNSQDSDPSKAVLSHDPIGSLPNSFTICSTVMAPFVFTNDQILFLAMLDKNGNGDDLLRAVINIYMMTNEGIDTKFNWKRNWKELEKDGKELKAFPQQWIKGCVAFNLTSGLHQVVVDGVFVRNETWPKWALAYIPRDLSGKIVLGGRKFIGHWKQSSNKVTNLNIFSTAHSVEVMRQNTVGGGTVGKSVFVSGIPFFKAEFS